MFQQISSCCHLHLSSLQLPVYHTSKRDPAVSSPVRQDPLPGWQAERKNRANRDDTCLHFDLLFGEKWGSEPEGVSRTHSGRLSPSMGDFTAV
jgi:hypothetical protein